MPTATAPSASRGAPPRAALQLLTRSVLFSRRLLTSTVHVASRPGEPSWALAWRCALTWLVELAIRLVSPQACAACDVRLSGAEPRQPLFCEACQSTCAEVPVTRELVAGGSYTGALAIAVKRLKYSSRPDLARPLGAWLSDRARRAGLTADLVIPVPLHPRKLRDRGYNQSALVASHVARALGARFSPRALTRTRDTAPQASLDREGRRGNIAGAFAAWEKEAIRGKHIVLIDDVATTGATLTACMDALKLAGASSITALVLAKKDVHAPESPCAGSPARHIPEAR